VEKFAVSTIYMLLYLASESSPCCERWWLTYITNICQLLSIRYYWIWFDYY
jgi:hypothetical protein